MNFDKYNDFVASVKKLNEAHDVIDSQRQECYGWIADKIKSAFKDSNNPVPSIFIVSDGSRIECTWMNDINLKIPVDLIVSLHMPFDFGKKLNTSGSWEKQLIFYPLEEES